MIDAFRCHLALKNLGIVSLFASKPFKARGVLVRSFNAGDYYLARIVVRSDGRVHHHLRSVPQEKLAST